MARVQNTLPVLSNCERKLRWSSCASASCIVFAVPAAFEFWYADGIVPMRTDDAVLLLLAMQSVPHTVCTCPVTYTPPLLQCVPWIHDVGLPPTMR
eukprot:3175586-Rhodomonas_salina.1